MLPIEFFHVVLLAIALRMVDSSTRKISGGKVTQEEMRYMVYLTKAERSATKYDAWICGGAIVSEDFIVTSAACVEDVQYMYAIAGYNKYLNVLDLLTDSCAIQMKKKIVYICVPKSYNFAYDKIEQWALIDIAAVKVESPYNFNLPATTVGCSWKPNKIEINYDKKYQEPDTDAMILGWGHKQKWRNKDDKGDYNEKLLMAGSILIMDKSKCKALYKNTPALHPIIDKYMICAMNEGNINDKGEIIKKAKPDKTSCAPGYLRIDGLCQMVSEDGHQAEGHPDEIKEDLNPDQYRSSNQNDEETITFDDIVLNVRRSRNNNSQTTFNYTRKAGICQNDHGGPLVTWVGKHEVLIGVASVFQVNKALDCVGPYLFTSTHCNSAFLDCVINSNSLPDKNVGSSTTKQDLTRSSNTTYTSRSARHSAEFCNLPPEEKGFDIVERRISWRLHPDGPAANELSEDLFYRPMKPLG